MTTNMFLYNPCIKKFKKLIRDQLHENLRNFLYKLQRTSQDRSMLPICGALIACMSLLSGQQCSRPTIPLKGEVYHHNHVVVVDYNFLKEYCKNGTLFLNASFTQSLHFCLFTQLRYKMDLFLHQRPLKWNWERSLKGASGSCQFVFDRLQLSNVITFRYFHDFSSYYTFTDLFSDLYCFCY